MVWIRKKRRAEINFSIYQNALLTISAAHVMQGGGLCLLLKCGVPDGHRIF